jgi:hypothetical protein
MESMKNVYVLPATSIGMICFRHLGQLHEKLDMIQNVINAKVVLEMLRATSSD